jgi:hypothetical protein
MKKSKTQKCVCKRCFSMRKTLAALNDASPQWYPTLTDGRTDVQRALSMSAERALLEMCCPPVEHPALGLNQCDEKTGKIIVGGKAPFSIRAQACQEGNCDKCPGWNGVHSNHPLRSVTLPKIPGGFGKAPTLKLRCCPIAWSDDQFVHHKFQKLGRGKGASQEKDATFEPGQPAKKTSEIWAPVVGTRADFMAHLYHTFIVWREHHWYVHWHSQHSKVQRDYFGLQAAAGVGGLTAEQLGAVFLCVDFASKLAPDRCAEVTGVFKDSTNVLVMHFTHDFRLQKVSDLEPGRMRSGLEGAGVESYHTASVNFADVHHLPPDVPHFLTTFPFTWGSFSYQVSYSMQMR